MRLYLVYSKRENCGGYKSSEVWQPVAIVKGWSYRSAAARIFGTIYKGQPVMVVKKWGFAYLVIYNEPDTVMTNTFLLKPVNKTMNITFGEVIR